MSLPNKTKICKTTTHYKLHTTNYQYTLQTTSTNYKLYLMETVSFLGGDLS